MRPPKPEPPDVQTPERLARDLGAISETLEAVAEFSSERAEEGGYQDNPRYLRVKTGIDKLRDRITAELLGIEDEIKAAKP